MKRARKFIFESKLPCGVLLLFIVVQIIFLFAYPQSERPSTVISWDTFGYYLYLPATFIYKDLFQLKFIDHLMHQYALSGYFYQAHIGPLDKYVMGYPLGMSILYFPFFVIGHIAAMAFGYKMDGFSAPYQYSIFIGGVIYSIIGIVVMIRNLRFYFGEKLTAFLLVILLFGTNYFYYITIENAMTHGYLFTAAALIIYLSIKWHQTPRALYALFIGVLSGLVIVIRPTEIFWCLIPLLWTLKDEDSAKQKVILVRKHIPDILILIFGAFCVGIIQIIYWKIATGKFLYYSYRNLGFDFLHPHILQGLFSFRKGWLIYTPVMVLSLLGIPLLWRQKRELFFVCVAYTVLVVYVTFSWQVWWYGGSFGQRSMIESYALLLFPMGFFMKTAFQRSITKYASLLFIAFCIFLNGFQTWQYLNGFWSTEGPIPFTYKLTFLRTHRTREMIRDFLNLERPERQITDSSLIYSSNFESSGGEHTTRNMFFSGNTAIKLNQAAQSELLLDSVINTRGYDYIRIDGKARFEPFEYDVKKFARMVVTIKSDNKVVLKEATMPMQPLIGNALIKKESDVVGVPGVWDEVFMYVKLPPEPHLLLQIEINNRGYNDFYFDDLSVALLKEAPKME